MNGTIQEYQSNSETVVTPMISLGFKETESVQFDSVMKDFILGTFFYNFKTAIFLERFKKLKWLYLRLHDTYALTIFTFGLFGKYGVFARH